MAVDLEGIHSPIEVAVHPQYEVGVGVYGAVSGKFDVAPIQSTDPVDLVDLGVALNVHVRRQFEPTVDKGTVGSPGVGTAATMKEVDDLVVGLGGFQPGASRGSAHGRFVGEAGEHVHRETTVVVVQAHWVRNQGASVALSALVIVPQAGLGVASPAIFVGMESDRSVVIFAFGIPTTHGLFERPDAALLSQPLDLLDDGGIGSDRRIIEARLAAYRGDLTAFGAV